MKKYLIPGYLVLIFTLLPLYMKSGFYELGECKGITYLCISTAFAIPGAALFIKREKTSKDLTLPAFAGGVFVFSNILSFMYSVNPAVSFFGLDGWRCGFLTEILMFFFFFLLIDFRLDNIYLLAVLLITPLSEFVIGILDRFSVYIIDMYGRDPTFLATIGNINWYMGYLSVFVPVGLGLCYTEKTFSKLFLPECLYTVLGLMAILIQGSDAGAIVITGSYVFLLLLSVSERESLLRYLALVFILGLSMEMVFVMRLIFADGYTYEPNLLLDICEMHIGVILMGLSFFLYRLARLMEGINREYAGKKLFYICLVMIVFAITAAGFAVFITFDYSFGNGRGLIWSLSLDMFEKLSPWQKLVGVGQDCFYEFAYSDPETADSLFNVFGADILTNAHCEFLTILIERGILGIFGYVFFIGTVMRELFRNKKERTAIVCALPVVGYLCNCVVSFSQVMSTSYFFIAMGIGLSSCKRDIS